MSEMTPRSIDTAELFAANADALIALEAQAAEQAAQAAEQAAQAEAEAQRAHHEKLQHAWVGDQSTESKSKSQLRKQGRALVDYVVYSEASHQDSDQAQQTREQRFDASSVGVTFEEKSPQELVYDYARALYSKKPDKNESGHIYDRTLKETVLAEVQRRGETRTGQDKVDYLMAYDRKFTKAMALLEEAAGTDATAENFEAVEEILGKYERKAAEAAARRAEKKHIKYVREVTERRAEKNLTQEAQDEEQPDSQPEADDAATSWTEKAFDAQDNHQQHKTPAPEAVEPETPAASDVTEDLYRDRQPYPIEQIDASSAQAPQEAQPDSQPEADEASTTWTEKAFDAQDDHQQHKIPAPEAVEPVTAKGDILPEVQLEEQPEADEAENAVAESQTTDPQVREIHPRDISKRNVYWVNGKYTTVRPEHYVRPKTLTEIQALAKLAAQTGTEASIPVTASATRTQTAPKTTARPERSANAPRPARVRGAKPETTRKKLLGRTRNGFQKVGEYLGLVEEKPKTNRRRPQQTTGGPTTVRIEDVLADDTRTAR